MSPLSLAERALASARLEKAIVRVGAPEGERTEEIYAHPLRGADGVFRPFLTRVLPVRGQDGAIVRWFGTNTDITTQRKTEEALQYGNARLDLLADTAGRLLASDSPQEVVNALCQKVMAFLDCHAFFNFLVDEETGRLHLNACAGIPEEEKQEIEWLDYGVAVCGCAAPATTVRKTLKSSGSSFRPASACMMVSASSGGNAGR